MSSSSWGSSTISLRMVGSILPAAISRKAMTVGLSFSTSRSGVEPRVICRALLVDGGLVVLDLQERRRAPGNLPGPLGRQEHELEAVRDSIDTVFDGNARHQLKLQVAERKRECYSSS
jgi:hypothetical protein